MKEKIIIIRNKVIVYENDLSGYQFSRMDNRVIESVFDYIENSYHITILCAQALIDSLRDEDELVREKYNNISVNDYVFEYNNIHVFPSWKDGDSDDAIKWCVEILKDVDDVEWEVKIERKES